MPHNIVESIIHSSQGDPSFTYLPFPIGRWRSVLSRRTPEATFAFFRPLFDFVDESLAAGEPVLIHCLAGAHRAGTAGVACSPSLPSVPAAALRT